MNFDLGIIGGGPGGYTSAERAGEKGLSVVLFEKNLLGGTCLNRGCIPTKALLHGAAKGENFSEIYESKEKTVETLRKGVETLVKKAGVTVVNGEALIEEPGKISCNGETYDVKNIIIATGASPVIPPIPGSDTEGVYTSDDLLEGRGKNFQSLTIIGGGVIGVEIASFYAEIGTQVTILEAMDHILPQMSKEIAQRAGMLLKKKGVEIHDRVNIRAICGEPGHISVIYLDKKDEEITITSDAVLMATGRRASADKLFANDLDIEIKNGAIVSDESGRTSVPGIYVIGDARAGNIQLAHVAEAQGINAVSVICGEEQTIDINTVPSCIYTEPEMAVVGLSEEEAKGKGMEVRTVKVPTGSNGKCLIEESESGFVKLILDENDVILGAQLICPRATDMIGELALAISKGLTKNDIASVIHPHPTVSELIQSAARSIDKT